SPTTALTGPTGKPGKSIDRLEEGLAEKADLPLKQASPSFNHLEAEPPRSWVEATNRPPLEQRSVNGMSPELREEVACKRRGPLSEIERRSTEEKQRHKIGSCIQLSGGIE
ncbi:hypothetical protein THAOC_09378, partial [Thalassiosira oceanica]